MTAKSSCAARWSCAATASTTDRPTTAGSAPATSARAPTGVLAVTDRKKDLVITGGMNVHPRRVEAVLASHPDVADVCVIGAPDAEWGERVVAVVVARDGASAPDLEALRAFARDRLTPEESAARSPPRRRDPPRQRRQGVASRAALRTPLVAGRARVPEADA